MGRSRVGVIRSRDVRLLQVGPCLRGQRIAANPDEDHTLTGFRHPIVTRMKHLRRQYDVAIIRRLRKILLDDVMRIPQADQALHVLRDEDLGLRDIDHLLHPVVELATALLGRNLLVAFLPIMRFV